MWKKGFRSEAILSAEKIVKQVDWDDLVLEGYARSDLEEIGARIEHGDRLSPARESKACHNRGLRVLFAGPSGTGKTLAASMLGQLSGRDVYRIALTSLSPKYIGETEKNLARIFDRAGEKRWILFFDEADALFGKRTGARNASDRYANQEVSYLLQHIETYSGPAILASNGTVNEALLQRFHSVVYFPKPAPGVRDNN